MNLSRAPKFHVLCGNAQCVLQEMDEFFDMRGDAIELWNQIRTHNFARTRLLRSEEKQKFNAAKCDHANNDQNVNNITSTVSNETKIQFRKK